LAEGEKYVRGGVAQNPNTPEDVLRKLAEDDDENVREKVARNPNTPKDLLRQLANDHNVNVRFQTFINPKMPLKFIESEYEIKTRQNVAEGDITPVLEKLAKDKEPSVRLRIVKNSNISHKTLEKLVEDEDSRIRKIAKYRLLMKE
jgi:HEAT repeat protein